MRYVEGLAHSRHLLNGGCCSCQMIQSLFFIYHLLGGCCSPTGPAPSTACLWGRLWLSRAVCPAPCILVPNTSPVALCRWLLQGVQEGGLRECSQGGRRPESGDGEPGGGSQQHSTLTHVKAARAKVIH